MADISEAIARPRGRVKSCTSCRQVKLRCDAVTKFPAACSRCATHGLDCRIDSNFKRVSVRGRLEEMSRKVNSLQNDLSQKAPQIQSTSSSALLSGPTSASSSTSFSGQDWITLSDFETNHDKTWSLGGVVLGYQDVSELLHIFAFNYYDHLPIFDPLTSVSDLYDSNQLLFWTIMRVASYRYPKLTHIFQLSSEAYQHLLMSYLVAIVHDYRTIQALIILCHWPNSGQRQSQDPSWQYCGVALNVCLQMGMNHTRIENMGHGFHGKSNIAQMSVYSRHMTWLACFHVSTYLSVWLGVPPHLSAPAQLNAISATAKEPHIPPQFMVQVEIQRQVVQYSTALAGDVDPGTASTLLNLFNNELDNLVKSFKDLWSPRLETQLLGAKLYLFSLCLTIASKRNGTAEATADSYVRDPTRFPVQLGLSSAVSLIYNISEQKKRESVQQASGIIHYPKFYFRLVVFAVGFLMKFLSDSKAAQDDRELAISHITTAHQIFSTFSAQSDFANVAESIEMWAKNLREDKEGDADPVRTRSGASLLYSIISKFRDPESDSEDDGPTIVPGSINDAGGSIVPGFAATSLDTSDPTASNWGEAGPSIDLSVFQHGFDDTLESIQWMSDDMLSEMFRM